MTFGPVGFLLIEKAFAENWILITNDKDFGEKVYCEGRPHHSVVFLRLKDERTFVKISVIQRRMNTQSTAFSEEEWKRLVDEIVPDFVDPTTDGPLSGREEQWRFVNDYRVLLAQESLQWAEAERLQRTRVERTRQYAATALTSLPKILDSAQLNAIRSLAASLHKLGEIQRELGQVECVRTFKEAANLLHRIGDQAAEGVAVFNLGHAYKDIPVLRDLALAEQWYHRSLELCAEGDRLWRGKCLITLGLVAYERFKYARVTNKPDKEFAAMLAQAGRLADAREYAFAARRNFETYDNRATEDIQKTKNLIEKIEQDIANTKL